MALPYQLCIASTFHHLFICLYCQPIELVHYPLSGTDGGLDFGTIRVNEERKETCTLKNKGKYEITFKSVHVAPLPQG